MAEITKDMKIGDVVEKYPETMQVFANYGLHCIGCHVAAWETIEQGAMAHGVSDVDGLVEALNKAIPKGK